MQAPLRSNNEAGKTYYKLTSKAIKSIIPDVISICGETTTLISLNSNKVEVRIGLLGREVFETLDDAIKNVESRIAEKNKEIDNYQNIINNALKLKGEGSE